MTSPNSPDANPLESVAINLVSRLVDAGIDGFGPLDPAVKVAEAARADNPTIEDAVDDLIRKHTALGAAGGFVTGLGGFVTLPISLPANVAEFYLLATRMVAGIAHLRGYDLARDETRAAIMLALTGADNRTLLQKAGYRSGQKIADIALGQLPQPALMVINKGVGFHLLAQTGKTTLSRFGRVVPLIGGVMGAGFDWWLLRRVAHGARQEFPQRAITAAPTEA